MGWLYSSEWPDKKAMVEHLIHPETDYYRVLAHSVVGNHLWMATERKQDQERSIVLCLMAGKRNYGWGYKDVSEGMGPYETDCPLYLFDMVPEPQGEYSKGWRDRVRAYHEKKRAESAMKRTLEVGATVQLIEGLRWKGVECSPRSLRIVSKKPLVGADEAGMRYRISPRHIASGVTR